MYPVGVQADPSERKVVDSLGIESAYACAGLGQRIALQAELRLSWQTRQHSNLKRISSIS